MSCDEIALLRNRRPACNVGCVLRRATPTEIAAALPILLVHKTNVSSKPDRHVRHVSDYTASDSYTSLHDVASSRRLFTKALKNDV